MTHPAAGIRHGARALGDAVGRTARTVIERARSTEPAWAHWHEDHRRSSDKGLALHPHTKFVYFFEGSPDAWGGPELAHALDKEDAQHTEEDAVTPEEEIQRLKARVAQQASTIDLQSSQNATLQRKYDEEKERRESVEKTLESNGSIHVHAINRLHETVKRRDATIESLTADLDEALAKIDELNGRVQMPIEEVEPTRELECCSACKRQVVRTLEFDANAYCMECLDELIGALNEERDQAEKEASALLQELRPLRDELAYLKQRPHDIEQNNRRYRQLVAELKDQITRLQNQLRAASDCVAA